MQHFTITALSTQYVTSQLITQETLQHFTYIAWSTQYVTSQLITQETLQHFTYTAWSTQYVTSQLITQETLPHFTITTWSTQHFTSDQLPRKKYPQYNNYSILNSYKKVNPKLCFPNHSFKRILRFITLDEWNTNHLIQRTMSYHSKYCTSARIGRPIRLQKSCQKLRVVLYDSNKKRTLNVVVFL